MQPLQKSHLTGSTGFSALLSLLLEQPFSITQHRRLDLPSLKPRRKHPRAPQPEHRLPGSPDAQTPTRNLGRQNVEFTLHIVIGAEVVE